jgi:hypothetical protein
VCLHKGYDLCKSESFCTDYVPPSAIDIPQHDSWIAVGDSENEWLTFRRGWNNRICKTHTEVAGTKPDWGTSTITVTSGDMYRAGLCCGNSSSGSSSNIESACNISSGTLNSKPSSLTHWFDFSTGYGTEELTKIQSFTDIMNNATGKTVNKNVAYKPNVHNGLGAIYMNAESTGVEFTTNKLGSNPEILIAYRILSKTLSTNAGILFSSRNNGYSFGTYKTKDGYVGCPASSGSLIVEQPAPYDDWHIANLYFGNNDAFLIVDGDESKKNTFGIAGRYGTSSLTNVLIGFYPATDHYIDAYVGEVMYFNSKLSDSDRSMVTSYLMSKWGISSSGNTTCTESSIGESVSVISELQNLKPPKCVPPGGKNLQFDGTNWICVCINSYYHGDECQYKTPYEPIPDSGPNTSPTYITGEIHKCLMMAPIDGLCYDSPHGPMPEWNVSLVTNLGFAFSVPSHCCERAMNCDDGVVPDCRFWGQHNPDISKWDTSSVTSMAYLFGSYVSFSHLNSQFNQNISQWNTSKVVSMEGMFQCATAFNHYIGDWDTSSLITRYNNGFRSIFYKATAFQAKYTCASPSSYTVNPSSCKTVRPTWIAPPPPPSP